MPLNLNEHLGWFLTVVGLILLCAAVVIFFLLREKGRRSHAFSDPLTGGLTEVAFQNGVRSTLSHKPGSFALVSMQIENMAQISSSFGSVETMRLLAHVHGVLKGNLTSEELLTRSGEDSFCFLLKNRKQDEICARLERICNAINLFNHSRTDAFYLETVFGICLPQPDDRDAALVQNQAVQARQSGAVGRRYHFYDREYWEKRNLQQEMADAIDYALQTSEFVIHYQPKVRVMDQKIVGAEALIRWRHPQRGLLSADMFLPLAEQFQKSGRIDRFVFEEVCRTLARWKKQGREVCPISVNLARSALNNINYSEECFVLCSKYQVDPAQIEFEIEESHLLENLEQSKSLIERFRSLGFRIAVDHFGSGRTSLQLLNTLSIDTIKLDQSFFTGDNNSRRGRFIVESILKLATQLHIRTVAEGVDHPGQIQYLQQVACDEVQGFYYFKPASLEKFESQVFSDNQLNYADVQLPAPGEPEEKKHLAVGQAVHEAKHVTLFSYLPEEDSVEFSQAFSPILNGRKKFGNAHALFRTSELIHENDREDFFHLLERCSRESGWVENTLRFYIAEGRYGWLEVQLHREDTDTGCVISGTMVNISSWKSEINRWKEKANRDALTGLYNRDYFETGVQNQLDQKLHTSAAMMFIDVDDFKRVNDTLGHMVGDDVLCYVAKQILGTFRHTDVIARYGGDEFVVFAPSIARSVLEERLTKLCGAFKFPYRNDGIEYKVSVTIGAAMLPEDGTDFDTLLEHADCALYEAKERGKDQFVLYETYMQGDPNAQ